MRWCCPPGALYQWRGGASIRREGRVRMKGVPIPIRSLPAGMLEKIDECVLPRRVLIGDQVADHIEVFTLQLRGLPENRFELAHLAGPGVINHQLKNTTA